MRLVRCCDPVHSPQDLGHDCQTVVHRHLTRHALFKIRTVGAKLCYKLCFPEEMCSVTTKLQVTHDGAKCGKPAAGFQESPTEFLSWLAHALCFSFPGHEKLFTRTKEIHFKPKVQANACPCPIQLIVEGWNSWEDEEPFRNVFFLCIK